MTTQTKSTGILNERDAQSLADVSAAVRETTPPSGPSALTGDTDTPVRSATDSGSQGSKETKNAQRNVEHVDEPRPDQVQSVPGELSPDLLNSKDTLVLLRGIIVGLERLRQAVIRPPRSDRGDIPVVAHRVNVAASGTPVQGPRLKVPAGHKVLIRQRNHAGTPVGYVAFDRVSIAQTATRIEYGDGDKLEFDLDSLDQVWFDADTNSTAFELIVTR